MRTPSKSFRRERRPSGSDATYWSVPAQKFFLSLAQLPLINLSALCTLFGAGMLFVYFRSIDQMPADANVLLGLAVAATLCAAGIVLGAAAVLFGPTVIAHAYATHRFGDDPVVPFRRWELACAPVFAGSVVYLCLQYTALRRCSEHPDIGSVIALAIAAFGGAYLLEQGLIPQKTGHRLFRYFICMAFGIYGLMPLSFIYLQRSLFVGLPFDPALTAIVVGIFFSVLNTGAGTLKSARNAAIAAVVIVVMLFFWLSLMTSRPAQFPTFVATAVGVRVPVATRLGVPKSTCLLIQKAALDAKLELPQANCDHDSWNGVSAKILSNVGQNWLLEFDLRPAAEPKGESLALRVSVPAAGIQSSHKQAGSARSNPPEAPSCGAKP